ncbi:glycosyltransferase like family 2-domain-containing protein [Phyllosticta capitalensis]|uniref:Glycosyltransferase like family 2-domain-containing protein n=1 Tax=Phyllosticta capitalensis TaxID=121624 RepID=A0ABR1Y9J6_9PEZI
MLGRLTILFLVLATLGLFVAVAGHKTEHDANDAPNTGDIVSTFLTSWTRPVPLFFLFRLGLIGWSIFTDSFSAHFWASAFVWLFVFRYLRTVVNTIGYIRLKPIMPAENPKYTNNDVTVIVPTVEPTAGTFVECLQKIIANIPAQIFIVTVGEDNVNAAKSLGERLNADNKVKIEVLSVPKPSKREQVVAAVGHVDTELIVSCDDTVFWPSTLIKYIIAPFEKASVGLIGTCKRVRRNDLPFGMASFLNLLGVFRLERTNFDLAATYSIDGGMSCVSGRTCAIRTSIMRDPEFQHAFLNEYIFWGRFGPLNAGDDKFVTRWLYKKGWEVAHQKCPEAQIQTILGVVGGFDRFQNQCLRWARTSARDNPKMMFRDNVWISYPWLAYSVLFTSFFNYSLFFDPLIITIFWFALADVSFASAVATITARPMLALVLWMLAAKFVRLAPHYSRHPSDLRYAPGIILFGYWHSLIKLAAFFTQHKIEWGTRAGVDAAAKK